MMFLCRRNGASLWLSTLAWVASLLAFAVVRTSAQSWPLLDNGFQKTVQWDHNSIVINGERLFLFGGEMHPFRLPVPELWEDVLQKIKAMGMRMVSIYTHWGFHAPTPGKVDFGTGAHNLTRFLQMAKDIGLYVIVRPGPYINGELNAGGMALWVTTGAYGALRSNGTEFTKAWTPYQDGIARLTEPFQITNNGTVIMYQIENEYGMQWRNVESKTPNPEAVSYMEKLKENARKNGIVVPLIHNAPNQNGKSWSPDYDTDNAGGNVDIYGLDSYPQCWSCVLSECGSIQPFAVSNYYDHFQQVSPNQPSLMPEFQGGAMNPWTGPAGGCKENTNVDFVNFYYRDTIAQRITILNLYMIYGGTNWGWLAAPFIGSSYDYGAAIAEDRSIDDKYYEIKNLGLFTRAADGLAEAERVGSGTNYTDNQNVYTVELRNPKTGTGFYVVRHANSSSTSQESFVLRIRLTGLSTTINMNGEISGRESKIFVTNYPLGGPFMYSFAYCNAEIVAHSVSDGKITVVLSLPAGKQGFFHLFDSRAAGAWLTKVSGPTVVLIGARTLDGIIVAYEQREGVTVLDVDGYLFIVLVDKKAAYKTWAPALSNNPRLRIDDSVIVTGPDLVRSASLSSNTIFIKGDVRDATELQVFVGHGVDTINWNGVNLNTTKVFGGLVKASIPKPPSYSPPQLASRPWKSADSLPERHLNYTDTGPAWVTANHTTTPSSTRGTAPYLFSDEYGFHTGIRLWRGHFSGESGAAGVFLNVQGGTAHGWSAYLNGVFLGSWLGRPESAAGSRTLSFSKGTINAKGDNVLLVMHDDTGHDQLNEALNVRGILNATLLDSSGRSIDAGFTEWKLAGTAGESNLDRASLDPLRTHYNEGGLTAERLGWHLPEFDDSLWGAGRPSDGFKGAGVRFYRSNLPLDVPSGLDVSLAFRFSPLDPSNLGYRALLFVNGYQYGRYYPSIASENTFPVPVGVLDYAGDNVIGLAVWALGEGGAKVDVEVAVRYVVGSSLNVRFDGSYLRPGWSEERLKYA